MDTRKILIIDDEESVRYSFRKLFREPDYVVIDAANGQEGIGLVSKEKPDLVVADIEMPGMTGLEVIQQVKRMSPETPVLIVTAFGTTERVIAAMKYGAYEYLEKPFDIERLRSIVKEALAMRSLSDGEMAIGSFAADGISERIVGNSPAIKEVYKMIGRVAASDVSVLLVGESGTGKELVARAIHQYSNRTESPFLTINCAAIPDSLLESELFGHEKGSFTDARTARAGKFEVADKGTVFLDEIGDMSLPLQAKLLRVLQEGTIERLGSTMPIKVDVRIIAATNKNLEEAISRKEFREDLYYRLKVITITLPPLRMRKDDIPSLAQYFIQKHGHLVKKRGISFPAETMDALLSYHWPGNVRELENVIKRAMILSKSGVMTPDLINQEKSPEKPAADGDRTGFTGIVPDDMKQHEGRLYQHVIEETEIKLITKALSLMEGNQAKTARLLGISRVMLHERMRKYSIRPKKGSGRK